MPSKPSILVATSAAVAPETIHVCPLSAVDQMIARTGARHLVTLINNQLMIETPPGIAPHRHLRVALNDIAGPQPGLVHPNEQHVASLIGFAMAWDHNAPILVHCWAGISRSTAGSFIVLCTLNPDASETHIAQALRTASPTATPNRLMIQLADDALMRRGRMVEAIERIGRGASALEAEPFSLPAKFGA